MVQREQLRVSDGERQAAVDRLRHAHDEGRLDLDEYDRRLAAAYAAVTYGDLDQLFLDLPPAGAPMHVPAGMPALRAGRAPVFDDGTLRDMHVALKVLWIVWGCVVGINLTVWFLIGLGGDAPYFWPMWLAVPGVALFITTAVEAAVSRARSSDEPRR